MPIVATSLLALCAIAGAWLDIVSRRLPNWLCLVTAMTGLVAAFIGNGIDAVLSHGLHAAIALAIGMILFRFGLIGGGDAKFYAACAAWFPLASGLYLLGTVSMVGLVVVVGWFTYRQVTGARTRANGDAFAMVPYGLAIAIGAVALKAFAP
jgi:prepilin peptidase CpaA